MPRVLLAFEPPHGGVAEAVRQLATGLGAQGWEVELAGPPEAVVYPALERCGLRIHRLPWERRYARPERDARAGTMLARLLHRGRFDIVHAHSSKAGVIARVAAMVARVPAIYSPHGLAFSGPVSRARRLATLQTERAMGSITARLLCVCEHERRLAVSARLVPAHRAEVVLNGTGPCNGANQADCALSALRGDGVLAAAVALLRPEKRLDLLVDAAPPVLDTLPDARIAIVGNGPLEQELRARARALGLEDHPRFAILPFAPPATAHMHSLDAFVLCSEREAFPLGVLEAMACGVPQVCTDVGGVAEAVDERTGRLVPFGDPGALAGALVEVLGDAELRRSMAEASRRRHTDRFTVERMVAQTSAVYAGCLERSRGRLPERPS